jgi:biopolymer transport protein ExbB/TolQ
MPSSHPSFHRITAIDVFQFAGPLQKAVVIALLAAMAAAVVVLAVKLASGKKLDGGSAFLSSLRLGGPILGGLGACWSLFNMTLGYAGVPGDPSPKIMAPGFAEAFLQVGLGFLVGVVAVLCHWAVTSRIDRQVLGV